jgi:hypothetical protein
MVAPVLVMPELATLLIIGGVVSAGARTVTVPLAPVIATEFAAASEATIFAMATVIGPAEAPEAILSSTLATTPEPIVFTFIP